MIKVDLKCTNSFYLSDTTSLDNLSDDEKSYIYMFLLKSKDSNRFFPTYIGQTKYLRSRFLTHIKNILAGEYWIIDKANIEDYILELEDLIKYDSWSKMYEENSHTYEANYSSDNSDKFKKMLNFERMDIRKRYLKNTLIKTFEVSHNSPRDLTTQIEGHIILHFNELLAGKLRSNEGMFHKDLGGRLVHFHTKGTKRNNTVLGSISTYPKENFEINYTKLNEDLLTR